MGIALIVSSLGFFLQAAPHFLQRKISWQASNASVKSVTDSGQFCTVDNDDGELMNECDESSSPTSQITTKDVSGLWMMFFGNFIVGFGTNFLYAFGYPYSDDNVNKDNTPFMIGLIWASRLLGPALGYLMGAACLTLYINPWEEIDFGEGDPRWIGAWWLGYPLIGIVLLLFAPWIMLYPKRLPRGDTDAATMSMVKGQPEPHSPKEEIMHGWTVFKRLVRNKTYFFNVWSIIFFSIPVFGYAQFMPKYLEVHYRQMASKTGYLGGMTKTISAGTGSIIVGFLIGKFKPRARYISGYNVTVGVLVALLYFSLGFLECPKPEIVEMEASCDCDCSENSLQPICDSNFGVSYFK